MSFLSSIGPETYLAIATGIWFMVGGVAKMGFRPPTGHRALPIAPWAIVVRRLRGGLEFLGALAVIGTTALNFLQFSIPPLGLPLGLGLSALALWTAVEVWVPPLRPVRIILAILGFALAVIFAGFRG